MQGFIEVLLDDLEKLTGATLHNFKTKTSEFAPEKNVNVTLDGHLIWTLDISGGLFKKRQVVWNNGQRKLFANELAEIFVTQIKQGYGNLITIELVLQVTDEMKREARQHPDDHDIQLVPVPKEVAIDFKMLGVDFHEYGHLKKNLVTFFARVRVPEDQNETNETNADITPTP